MIDMANSSKNWLSTKKTFIDTKVHEIKFGFEPIRIKITAGAAALTYDFDKGGEFNESLTAGTTITLEYLSKTSIFIKLASANDYVIISAW